QCFDGFWEEDPTFGTPKSIVHFIEELVEVINHANFGEDAMHDVLPPSFLIFDRQWTGTAKLPGEGRLDRLNRGHRPVPACDAAIDLANSAACCKQRLGRIKKHGAKFPAGHSAAYWRCDWTSSALRSTSDLPL